jgi:hypothetical protein
MRVFLVVLACSLFAACSSVSVGDTVKLSNGNDVVQIARDISTFDRLTSAAVAKDDVGYAEASANAFFVADGTKALVIDRGFGRLRVRIKEGPYIDEVGWVPTDWAK